MIPHFPLDVPVDQITLQGHKQRENMRKTPRFDVKLLHVASLSHLLEGEDVEET